MVLLRSFAALVAVLALGGCDDRFPDYHYKMTVYVQTADGEKAFSTVRAVANTEYRSIQVAKAVRSTVRGEALIIDFPGSTSPVFAILSVPGYLDEFVAGMALRPERSGDEIGGLDAYSRWMQRMVATKGARDLPRMRRPASPEKGLQNQWPTFVAFDDSNDPSTVREVRPEDIGVTRITIEITDEPVSRDIEKRLPWLDRYAEEHRRLNGSNSGGIGTNELSDNLGAGAFRRDR